MPKNYNKKGGKGKSIYCINETVLIIIVIFQVQVWLKFKNYHDNNENFLLIVFF